MKKLLISTAAILVMAQAAYASSPQERLANSNASYFTEQGNYGAASTSPVRYTMPAQPQARLIEENHRYFNELEPSSGINTLSQNNSSAQNQPADENLSRRCYQRTSTICK